VDGKNVLVTGGAGFIGSHVVDRLIEEGPKSITVVDNLFLGKHENLSDARLRRLDIPLIHIDASDESSMRTIAAKSDFDLVFDLAVIPLPTSLTYPSWTAKVNFANTLVLCELARSGHIAQLIHFSSSEVYGSALAVPMSESHPLGALTPYAASKAGGDLLVNSYIETYGITATIIRPFNNFGPRQNSGSYAGIIPIVIGNLRDGKPIEIHGTGKQTRDFVYAPQTADLAVKAAKKPETKGKTFNIATGQETSILEIVTLMKSAFGKPSHPTIFTESRTGDVERHVGDTKLLQELLGETPNPINEKMLGETIEWYLRSEK